MKEAAPSDRLLEVTTLKGVVWSKPAAKLRQQGKQCV